jgi:hypothetical protein
MGRTSAMLEPTDSGNDGVALAGDSQISLQPERRKIPRRQIKGGAMAVFSGGPTVGRVTRVELVDASWKGIGIKSPTPAELGAGVSLVPEDAMWPRQTGVVVRCERDDDGWYRLGLSSRATKAAA